MVYHSSFSSEIYIALAKSASNYQISNQHISVMTTWRTWYSDALIVYLAQREESMNKAKQPP